MKHLKHAFILTITVLFLLSVSIGAHAQNLVGHWTFDEGAELADLTGNWGDITLNGATITDGQLDVGPGEWAFATEYSGPNITEKTMVSWLSMDDLSVLAGSAMTLDKISEDEFDAMVFGERIPQNWMNGSSFFRRTTDPDPGFEETETGVPIQLAISYEDDGGDSHMRLYRNGEQFGDYTQGAIPTWETGDAEVFWGLRHGNPDGGPGNLDAKIEESQLYDGVLSQAEIQALTVGKPTAVDSRGKLATQWATIKAK